MSLDVSKLEKVVDLANGMKRARCPACAETGSDKTGVHLRVYPDGRFGCCVHPQDKEHRKRIFALAGERTTAQRRGIVVKVAAVKISQPVKLRILVQVGQSFAADASDASLQVEMTSENCRTARTGETKSNGETVEESRTLRTGSLYSFNGAEKTEENNSNTLKDFRPPVRSVRECQTDGTVVDETDAEILERMESDASPF